MTEQQTTVVVPGAGSTTRAAGRKSSRAVVRVNLIPPEIAEARRLRGVQVAVGSAVLLTVAGVGALYFQQAGVVGTANNQLTAAKTENSRLQAEQSRLGNVNALYAKVDAANAMLTSAKAPQVLWSRYLEDVRLRLPEKTWLTSVAFKEQPAPAGAGATAPSAAAPSAATPVSDGAAPVTPAAGAARPGAAAPACSGTVATVSVEGSGYTHRDVADWLDRLAGLKAVTNPYLTSSTEVLVAAKVPTVAWNTTASLTCEALASAGKG